MSGSRWSGAQAGAGDGFLLFSNVELGIWVLLPLYTATVTGVLIAEHNTASQR